MYAFGVLCLVNNSICAKTWLVKEVDITNDGCPVAQPRLTRRPSAKRIIWLPLGNKYRWTWGLICIHSTALAFNHATSISQSKWPTLHTIESSGSTDKCSPRTISLQPVVVTIICAREAISSNVTTW